MLEIKNKEFFGFDVEVVDDYISVNIMVNPEKFELKSYRKSPFASLIVKSEILARSFRNLRETKVDVTHSEWVHSQIIHHFTVNGVIEYNTYLDSKHYDELTNRFDGRMFHTIIYYKDLDEYNSVFEDSSDNMVMIGAFPVKGIVSPITKSIHYQLYNGCLINCKPFRWGDSTDELYNKIVYVLVDIRTSFTFNEFTLNDSADPRGFMKSRTFYIDYFHEKYPMLECNKFTSRILYRGHESFFNKPCKNIFHLSDVPKDIMVRNNNDSLTVKLDK